MYAVGIAFFGALTQKALTRVRTHISVQSLRKQAVIINVLYTQTIIQVVFVSIPLCFLAFLFVSEADISNESHNYSIAVMAAANVVGPAYVLYTIPDYRKAIIGLPKGFSKSDIQTITRSS
ncbi:unnamed protein product [Auanema sp. JU1783]|nr:unnamed protein product [Auanema sp. JU1783]